MSRLHCLYHRLVNSAGREDMMPGDLIDVMPVCDVIRTSARVRVVATPCRSDRNMPHSWRGVPLAVGQIWVTNAEDLFDETDMSYKIGRAHV